MLAIAFLSASRKYPEAASNCIRAEAENTLEMPGAPSTMLGVQV